MKRLFSILIILMLICSFIGCSSAKDTAQIAATTLPVYEFTSRLCQGTDLEVTRLVTESVSCLHDYTLQVSQMRAIEGADVVILSGAGLEDFLAEALIHSQAVIDASVGIPLICPDDHSHEHEEENKSEHSHDDDPHIWLSPANAKIMVQNICTGLTLSYPADADVFASNLQSLTAELEALESHGAAQLSDLSCTELITFHEGFAYFAQAFGLTVLESVEEESGSEASASELIDLVQIVRDHSLPAIFTETNASVSAASIISAETGCGVYALDMAMAGDSYFDAMYHNIDTVKEALG